MQTAVNNAIRIGRITALAIGLAVTLAVMLGVATVALAAVPGDPFKLGKVNIISNATTALKGTAPDGGAILQLQRNSGKGPVLDIKNTSPASNSRGVNIEVAPGQVPISVVPGVGKASNLNVDQLDGRSADEVVRVVSFTGQSPLADGTDGTLATTNITVPNPGFLVINAGSDLFDSTLTNTIRCSIEVDNSIASGSSRLVQHNGNSNFNEEEDCSTNTVVPVSAGTHTVDFEAGGAESTTRYGDTALSAIYVPFDGTGAQPSSTAISAAQQVGRHDTRSDGFQGELRDGRETTR